MKKLLLTVGVMAFAVAVQAGDAKCSKSTEASKAGCCAKMQASTVASGGCTKMQTSTVASGGCTKMQTSTVADGGCTKMQTSTEAKGACPFAAKTTAGCCAGEEKVAAKRTYVKRTLLSPKAAAAL